MSTKPSLRPRIILLGELEYALSHAQMLAFTNSRDQHTRDEFWVLSHPPVYTQGTSCDAQPRPSDSDIPLVKTDRGGQITYHGPGQLVIYLMLDIKRLGVGPKRLVRQIEKAIIQLLAHYQIAADVRQGAPGVYVDSKKIAALGLRIRQGRTYHGLSLNVDMDLSPFKQIDPCGYAGLEITQIREQGVDFTETRKAEVENQLIDCLIEAIYCPTSED